MFFDEEGDGEKDGEEPGHAPEDAAEGEHVEELAVGPAKPISTRVLGGAGGELAGPSSRTSCRGAD